MKSGVELIAEERKRQIEVEGWDNLHDSDHDNMQLAGAAGCYVANAINKDYFEDKARFEVYVSAQNKMFFGAEHGDWQDGWPWDEKWDKRKKHDTKRSLVIAGALIAAELDRLNTEQEAQECDARKAK